MKVSNKKKEEAGSKTSVTFKTKVTPLKSQVWKWWEAKKDEDVVHQLLSTVSFLKEAQGDRYRQAAIYARLYGNKSVYNFLGASMSSSNMSPGGLQANRPTFNIVQSATDTLVSKIGQNRPAPVFLTDNADYKERRLAKQLNNFILGEFYQTKAYEKAANLLRDALVEGTGVLKVYETQDKKVGLDRVMLTDLLTDPNESLYGEPRQLYQLKLVDRAVLAAAMAPEYRDTIGMAEMAYPDDSASSAKTVSDLVMVVEGWRLPSGKDTGDGRHTIACTSGLVLDEPYEKDRFPFVFLQYTEALMGFWGQGLAEQLMGTQLEINSILYTISKAIKLVGVPRVFVEDGSKVTKASFNNEVGSIIYYRGTKPVYEVAPAVPQEMYAQLQRLIDYGYQQCGVSTLQASSEKPAGLNSGEAIRSYNDISTDRFAALSRRYDNVFIDLTYLMVDLAKDICKREGSYQTVYPNKNGAKEIDLPKVGLIQDPFIVQVFNQSSLPREPAGRMQKVTEMIQSGMISVREGRRLLDYPDLDQVERLANASEERILQILDAIVEDGKYTPPDPFMDLQLANDLCVQYYNLYSQSKLEEERCELLRNFFSQVQTIKQAATPAPMAPDAGLAPQASPEPLPQSPLVPNAVPQG